MNFFAPHDAYANEDPVAEFREMVAAMHAAGIEVWLDVVYNHTCEGDRSGPTYNLRGIDNDSYYIVADDGSYVDDSGCGNTTQGADPAMRALVVRSLRHWAEQGVDGFRFDLASILARDADGVFDPTDAPPLISEIGVFAAQQDVKVVAEAWDMGAYLLGRSFPGIMWRQWNGRYRDDIRGFVKGDDGLVPALMTRVYGSSDLFPDGPGDIYRPYQSINFITAHDGFCLYDLVSYNERHNEANGHGGTDGSSDNRSWNGGWEGDEGVPDAVRALRLRQMKNFFALLMLSNGVPMIVAGDEFANTQHGQQQPVQPGQRDDLAGLGSTRDQPGAVRLREGHDRAAQVPAQHCAQPVLARRRAVVRHHRRARPLGRVTHAGLAPVRGDATTRTTCT